MLKDQGVKNNGLTFLEEINSEWVSRSRLKVHPPQQVVEAGVVRRHIIQLTNIGHATTPEAKSRLAERSLN